MFFFFQNSKIIAWSQERETQQPMKKKKEVWRRQWEVEVAKKQGKERVFHQDCTKHAFSVIIIRLKYNFILSNLMSFHF